MPFIDDMRPGGSLLKSAGLSGLPGGHGVLGCGRFRGPAVLDQELMSELEDVGVPFGWELFVATVVVDEVDDADEIEEEELLRCIGFRGMNMPRTSSEFIAEGLCGAPLILHPERLSCWKEGGFATAVMRKDREGCDCDCERVDGETTRYTPLIEESSTEWRWSNKRMEPHASGSSGPFAIGNGVRSIRVTSCWLIQPEVSMNLRSYKGGFRSKQGRRSNPRCRYAQKMSDRNTWLIRKDRRARRSGQSGPDRQRRQGVEHGPRSTRKE